MVPVGSGEAQEPAGKAQSFGLGRVHCPVTAADLGGGHSTGLKTEVATLHQARWVAGWVTCGCSHSSATVFQLQREQKEGWGYGCASVVPLEGSDSKRGEGAMTERNRIKTDQKVDKDTHTAEKEKKAETDGSRDSECYRLQAGKGGWGRAPATLSPFQRPFSFGIFGE